MTPTESISQKPRTFEACAALESAANVPGMDAYRALVADAARDYEGQEILAAQGATNLLASFTMEELARGLLAANVVKTENA